MVRKNKPFARALVKSVCDDLLHEFRRALVQAGQTRHKGLLVIRMNDCEVIAPANARHFYILLDERAMIWIHSGLRRAVKDYLDAELLAVSHNAMKSDCDHFGLQSIMRAGVRDKVQWVPEKCRWNLKFTGANGVDTNYCKERGITLEIPGHLRDDDFKTARENAFRDACRVWNAIDKSGRRRIQLPEQKTLNISMVPVLKDDSHHGPDSESELERRDDEE